MAYLRPHKSNGTARQLSKIDLIDENKRMKFKMSAKVLCFVLVVLVISYDIEAFTAGAGNIGMRGRKRGLVNKVSYTSMTKNLLRNSLKH